MNLTSNFKEKDPCANMSQETGYTQCATQNQLNFILDDKILQQFSSEELAEGLSYLLEALPGNRPQLLGVATLAGRRLLHVQQSTI